jgi:hypothetical protein
VFWVPLLASVASGSASQGHFVNQHLLTVQVGLGGPTALAVLAMVAIVALVLTVWSRPSQVIAAVLVGTVLYQLLSVATLTFLHSQLQPHRAVTMMWVAYGAAVPVALESLFLGGAFARVRSMPVPRVALAVIATLALLATFALGAEQGADLTAGPFTKAAYTRRVPLKQVSAISKFITQTAGKPPQQLVIVTGNDRLLIVRPYFGFLPLRARYAHPEADLPGRIAALRAAAACADPTCTTRALTTSKFGPVDALVLARTPAGFRVLTQTDAFPVPHPATIVFPAGSFAPSTWATRDFGGYRVFVRRPH